MKFELNGAVNYLPAITYGKMKNSYAEVDFSYEVNVENDLDIKLTDGVELAYKHKLPKRIIDFIRTHHGCSLTYYFYKKALEMNPEAKEEDFRYPGPTPFSKETAILMMADSVEAATKSLKNPTYEALNEFVDRIVKKQLDDNQFANSDISFREIEAIKRVFKNKLINIYHVRIAYPE